MFVTIRGRRWEFVRKKLDGEHAGWCDSPYAHRKKITIDNRLSDFDELDVTLHELLHAADYDKAEEYVEEVATDIARVLWRLGYRKVDCDGA